jgi:hypothetical protein
MTEFTNLLSNGLAAGHSFEDALGELRRAGATPIEAIKAIHVARGVSSCEAKQIFSASPSWSREASAGLGLHDEAIALLARNMDARKRAE